MVKPPFRTKSLGTKASDGEYARLEELASAHGQTISELIRSVLLGRTGPPSRSSSAPTSRWRPSARRYDPHPMAYEYEPGAWVLKVDCQGKLDVGGHKWQINQALRGERVQLIRIEERVQVYYCRTLIRELDTN